MGVKILGLTMSLKDMIQFLEKSGYRFIRAKGGSHHIYGNGINTIPIPIHGNKDFGEDFIRIILNETGISKNELLCYLNRRR